MANPWISHVKAYHSKHPELTYKQSLQQAKHTYKKGQQRGEGFAEVIEPIKEFGETLLTSIIGSPELQAQRTEARTERRKAKDAEKVRRRKEREARRKR